MDAKEYGILIVHTEKFEIDKVIKNLDFTNIGDKPIYTVYSEISFNTTGNGAFVSFGNEFEKMGSFNCKGFKTAIKTANLVKKDYYDRFHELMYPEWVVSQKNHPKLDEAVQYLMEKYKNKQEHLKKILSPEILSRFKATSIKHKLDL